MGLKGLSNALDLMRYFTAQQPAWGVRELAKASGVHHAVVHRILATFADAGYLTQDELGRYALGLRWLEMGEIVRQSVSRTEHVAPVLRRLMEQSGETVFLSMLDDGEGVCLDIAHSEHQLRFSIEQGQRFALHLGAHGKAMLAFLPDAERAEICARAAASPADAVALEEGLASIRRHGWSQTYGEAAPGVAGVAVPLWRANRTRVAGSLAVCGPRQRLDEASLHHVLEMLAIAQRDIEGMVGLLG
ncbi:IclR family transcriptional regulator [Paraburkholderia bannensis]|uniref:IclR family transcriptional regulator n=1 Tax=Paraburkholderia bannensis TaxID=765414 RepID=UPI002ABE31B9|nr:IclR family transcriptional regulator [Paraburkholderia bannensis]